MLTDAQREELLESIDCARILAYRIHWDVDRRAERTASALEALAHAVEEMALREGLNRIEVRSGVNNCRWNVDGRCTCPEITRDESPPGCGRDWDSRQNCTLTIFGVAKCHRYRMEE